MQTRFITEAIITFFRYDGKWALEAALKSPLSGDRGLVLKDKAKHSAISAHLTKPFQFENKAFILQYEINFESQLLCQCIALNKSNYFIENNK